MKKLAVALVMLALTSPALADHSVVPDVVSQTNTPVEPEPVDCAAWAGLAEAVMEGRQLGVPFLRMMAVADAPEQDRIMIEMILQAFDTPQYSAQSVRDAEIRAFTDRWAVRCYRATR
jgi:hypothetical protein